MAPVTGLSVAVSRNRLTRKLNCSPAQPPPLGPRGLDQPPPGALDVAQPRGHVLSRKTIEIYVSQIFAKLGLHESPDDHRRVLAVLAFLRAR